MGFLTALLCLLAGFGCAFWLRSNLAMALAGPGLIAPLALVLADFNLYSLPLLWLITSTFTLLGWWNYRKESGRIFLQYKPAKATLAVLPLSFLFFGTHQYLHGGWDPGEYISTAHHIHRSGGIDYHDAFVADLPDELLWKFAHNPGASRPTVHAGYLMLDKGTGRMVPDYFHLYPAWLAPWASGAVSATYLGQTFLACTTLVLFFLVVREVAGIWIAFAATLLFVTNPAMQYFARFSSSEFLSMATLLGLLLVLNLAHRPRSLPYALLLVSYACTTAHITNLIPLAAVFLVLFVRNQWSLLLPVVFGTALGIVRNAIVTPLFLHHLWYQYIVKQPMTIAGLLLISLLLICILHGSRRIWEKRLPRLKPFALWLLPLGFAVFCVYQGVIRPGRSDHHNALNLLSIVWLMSPVGLVLALLGLFPGKEKRSTGMWFLLAAGLLSFGLLIHDKNIQPLYMWAYRRYLPIVLPMLFVLMASGAAWVWKSAAPVWLRSLGFGLLLLVLGWQSTHALPMFLLREHRGLPGYLSRIAEPMRDADLVVCDHPKLATPLRHAFDLPAYQLSHETTPVTAAAQAQVLDFLRGKVLDGNDRNIYFVSHSRGFVDPVILCEPLASDQQQSTMLVRRRSGLPQGTQEQAERAEIYRLSAMPRDYRWNSDEYAIDVGYHSLGLAGGFHAHQHSRGISFRWTNGDASLYLPTLRDAANLHLRLAHKRSDPDPVAVQITLDGNILTTLDVKQDWAEYTVALPDTTHPVRVLGLTSSTWNPADYGTKGYPPDLGIRVDRVSVKRR